jgi:hypothetical protein
VKLGEAQEEGVCTRSIFIDFYLSSSELDNNTALGVYFNCCGATSYKYHDNWVRAIRAF